MKEFEPLNLQDPVLDEFGVIDVDYYQMKAERLRAEYLRELSEILSDKIKKLVSGLATLITCSKSPLSH
jgi:hypothetical protein